jgi:hypothetical protein
MTDDLFLTVTLANGCRACVNLHSVYRLHELRGKATFVFSDGSVLHTEDDFEALALKLGAEVHPAIPREQLPLLAHR